MTFVGEATRDGGLNLKKGEFVVYAQGEGGLAVRSYVTREERRSDFPVPTPNCGDEVAVGISRPELKLRLAAMGLRLRRFPCDSYHDHWRMFGTEAV
jgi:hypothetical protein